jgi:hypothetical protein
VTIRLPLPSSSYIVTPVLSVEKTSLPLPDFFDM